MSHELEKLLGGFAADTLTPEEKQQLFHAALRDQDLFNALADEQALKELLADPAVRRRLLQALQATRAERTGGSWFDWFRRPTGLAWAGGFSGAVLAVLLGTRIYQESLRQESQLTAKEEATVPAASQPVPAPPQQPSPPTNEPQATSEPTSPPSPPPIKEALADKTAAPIPPSHTAPVERRARQSRHDAPAPHIEADTIRNKTESSTNMLSKSSDEPSQSASRPTVSTPPPSQPGSPSLQGQTEVDSMVLSKKRASPSARSLFYGAGPQRESQSTALDPRRREKAMSESGQPPARSEITTQPFAMAKSKRASPQQPVGIRYNLTHREPSEHFQDGTTETATPEMSYKLTIESNQDGFLQVWMHVGTAEPQLLFPTSGMDQPRSKLTAHTHLTISIPSTPGMLVLRFSRMDNIPPTTFDRALLNDSTRHHLRESVLTDETSSFPTPIHYAVNQDPSLPEIVVHIAPWQP
ncbi:MAG TPA: hypothetical protein PKD12_17665 [Nitrospira sp.]|nr:hypothetical protein [Nitrospira sp.]